MGKLFDLRTKRKREASLFGTQGESITGDSPLLDANSENSGVNNFAGNDADPVGDYWQSFIQPVNRSSGIMLTDDGSRKDTPASVSKYGVGGYDDKAAPTWQGVKDTQDLKGLPQNDYVHSFEMSRPIVKGNTINGQNLTANKDYIITDKDGNDHRMTYTGIGEDKLAHFTDENGNDYSQDVSAPVAEDSEDYLKTVSNADFLRQQGLDTQAQMQKDYEEYMKNAPEYISEEEQARRLRSSQSAKTVADLGSLASAFANLYYTDKGAYNQQVAYAKAPDYNSYITQWGNQRNAYRTYAQKGRDYVYQKQMKAVNEQYNHDLNNLKLEYQKAQVDLAKERATALQKADAAKLQALEQKAAELEWQHDYKMQQLEETRRKNDAQLGIAAARLGETQRHNTVMESKNSSSSSGSGRTKIYKGGNYNYDIPTSTDQTRMENKIIEDMIKRGKIDDNNYIINPTTKKPLTDGNGNKIVDPSKPKKSHDELVKDMHKNWDTRAGDIIRNDYEGSKRGESTATPSQPTQTKKPVKKTTTSSSSSSSTSSTNVSSGGNKSFGNNYIIKDTTKNTTRIDASSGSNKHTF